MAADDRYDHFDRPEKLDFSGVKDIATQWKRFKRAYELYEIIRDLREKPEKKQCSMFLNTAGSDAIEIFDTWEIPEEEVDKIDPLIRRFEEYCLDRGMLY